MSSMSKASGTKVIFMPYSVNDMKHHHGSMEWVFDIAALGLYGMKWKLQNTKKDSENKRKVTVIVCQYKETSTSLSCGTTYVRRDSSTGNAIAHLC
ncbi:hypothetical protein C1645_831236 [Glomus cerebriforme]|uniref:Uncharacterized protein n=1 Tax=Glomus cerebriforme TaxID=658196 RepID=A0A397SR32_9GLOM|nr:hypothetical protein C1645_831236 [Glomus cerebriforme]